MSVACGMECVVVLKGSSHGRTATDKPKGEIDEITTLKDLDHNFVFRLQGKWYHELMKQIDLDCEFLEVERLMDYSLLGCMRWVWWRCTYIGANDSATCTFATPDEFDPFPRVCRLVLAVYELDLHNPHFIPTCGFHPNPDWVVKRVTYDVSMMSYGPVQRSVNFGLAWRHFPRCQAIFLAVCRPTHSRWNCSKGYPGLWPM